MFCHCDRSARQVTRSGGPPPLLRLAAKSVKIPSPDVRAMKARAAAIVRELETGGKNGKNKNNRELSRQSQ